MVEPQTFDNSFLVKIYTDRPSYQFTGSQEVKVTRRRDRFAIHLLKITHEQPLRTERRFQKENNMDARRYTYMLIDESPLPQAENQFSSPSSPHSEGSPSPTHSARTIDPVVCACSTDTLTTRPPPPLFPGHARCTPPKTDRSSSDFASQELVGIDRGYDRF